MKFDDLNPEDKIRNIKEQFTLIIEEVINDHSVLKKYFPLTEPQITIPKLAVITSEMTEETKKQLEEDNKKLLEEVEKLNQASKEVFEKQSKDREKIKAVLSNLKPMEYCICEPRELDISGCLNSIIPEFEVFLDRAREIATGKTY